ncbi:MAG: integrin alpha [Planctomycetota bacterium]|nr:integrin alpha [Planctomycetota bacterium]
MNSRNCLHVAIVPALALAASAQTLQQSIPGGPGFRFGSAVHVVPDQNNDGYPDVLVGAPGSNAGNGSLRCLSGKFLATSIGNSELWSLTPAVSANAGFGASIIEVASLTGTSANDFIVGAPDYKVGSVPTGALLLVDGATHTVAWTLTGYPHTRTGTSLAAVGDQDGDGRVEVAIAGPSTDGSASFVVLMFGSAWGSAVSVPASFHARISNGSAQYGAVVSSGFDLDHDGFLDLAIGSPDVTGSGIFNVHHANLGLAPLTGSVGLQAGERFGASIDGRRDFDGDGTVDFVVGAPAWDSAMSTNIGRAVVLSGARMLSGNLPYEIFSLQFSTSLPFTNNIRFGTSVRAIADLNGDAVPDLIVGAPGYVSPSQPTAKRGGAAVISGATGVRMVFIQGAGNEQLGDVLGDAPIDLGFDGYPEFGIAGSNADTPSTDCGTVKFFALFPVLATTYCTGKVNSAGCTPSLTSTGSASVSSPSPCTVTCANLLNQKSGLFVYSHTPKATPFQGGVLCVGSPTRRTSSTNSGGSSSGTDCTGSIAFDVNARIQSGLDPTLVVGAEMFCQCWARDPASPSQTSLSNGVRFVLNP